MHKNISIHAHIGLDWNFALWRHHMEVFFTLLASCADNSPVTGEFPSQRASNACFDVSFDVSLNIKRLNKQSSCRWFETPGCSFSRHCNETHSFIIFRDDIMTWKLFRFTSLVWGAVMRSFNVFCSVRLNKLLNKHSSFRWCETPWCSCEVTVTIATLVSRTFARVFPLPWRHNDHDSVSNHQPHDCFYNRLFRQIKGNIKAPRHWPLCGEFTGTGEFPAQRASNAEIVSIWWRHHECTAPAGQRSNTEI